MTTAAGRLLMLNRESRAVVTAEPQVQEVPFGSVTQRLVSEKKKKGVKMSRRSALLLLPDALQELEGGQSPEERRSAGRGVDRRPG
jgi:hypothetical protein